MKSYPLIDVFKFVASLLVLVIHFRPFGSVDPTLDFISAQMVSRVAVPFFLICAGYFSAEKGLNHEHFKKTIIKLLKLYFAWSMVYAPIVWLGFSYNQNPFSLDVLYWLRDIFFQGTILHLWYLPAVIFAYFLIEKLLFKFTLRQILVISFVFYVIGLSADGYYGFVSQAPPLKGVLDTYLTLFASSRNGLFFAFFMMSLGMVIHQENWVDRIQLKQMLIGLFFGIILMVGEIGFLELNFKPFDYNMFLSLIPVTALFLLIGLKVRIEPHPFFLKLRILSSLVYFSHMWFFWMVMIFFVYLGQFHGLDHTLIRYLFFVLLTILGSLFMMRRKEKGGRWVRYLF